MKIIFDNEEQQMKLLNLLCENACVKDIKLKGCCCDDPSLDCPDCWKQAVNAEVTGGISHDKINE